MKKSHFAALAFLVLLGLAPFYLAPFHQPAVLMYHRVGYPEGASPGLFVSPQVFERQMEFLRSHNYHVLPLSDVVARVKNGEKLPMNTVVITFDDGYLDNFTYAFPVLKKMDFPAAIFMITDNINRTNWLSEEDLRILADSGVTIGSHTLSHAFLPPLSREDMEKEIAGSKVKLEAVLGRPVTLFSYPAGGVSDAVEDVVKEAGYEGAVTTNYKSADHDPFAIRRVKVSDAHGNLFNFWAKASGFYHVGKKKVEAMAPGE